MAKFILQGGKKLKGEVSVQGAKNAATPILAASMLIQGNTILENIPHILDVEKTKHILERLGMEIANDFPNNSVQLNAAKVRFRDLDFPEVRQMRSSILLIGPLLARFGKVKIPHPGGCHIGARPLDTHLDALQSLGVKVHRDKDYYFLEAKALRGATVVLEEFSVTATENLIMAAVLAHGKTVIKLAACEPHVQDLICFLRKAGAKVKGAGTHTIVIDGVKKLHSVQHKIIPDMIEAGTLIIAGLITGGTVKVKDLNPTHLEIFLKKLKEMGGRIIVGKDYVQTLPSLRLRSVNIQTLPYPGFPTDLQAPFAVLLTQSRGTSLIHDPMYEGRLKYLEELKKMGAKIEILDPHRARISGGVKLRGRKITSLDLRAGATLILAALAASGRSIIERAEEIDRGYERIEEKLKSLGAEIKRVE